MSTLQRNYKYLMLRKCKHLYILLKKLQIFVTFTKELVLEKVNRAPLCGREGRLIEDIRKSIICNLDHGHV